MKRARHPLDSRAIYHPGGAAAPFVLLARDGVEIELAELVADYVEDRISVHQLEERAGEVLGRTSHDAAGSAA